MKQKKFITFCLAGILLFGSISLTGCSFKDTVLSFLHKTTSSSHIFKVGDATCSAAEAKIILLTYQKEYSSLYGINVWNEEESSDQQDTLESYIKDLTISELAKIYTLDAIATDQDISLSSAEKSTAAEAATEYFNSLSDDEISYLGIDRNNVESLYERCALAEKIFNLTTKDVESEVSDDEARIAIVDEISTTDETSISSALSELNNGTDFKTVASTYSSADSYEIKVSRSTFPDSVIEQIFDLKDDTYSDIISDDEGNYYIFYCVKSYDPDLTQSHKAEVLKERKEDAFASVYDEYVNATSSSLNESAWEDVHVDTTLQIEGESFISVYNQFFENDNNE